MGTEDRLLTVRTVVAGRPGTVASDEAFEARPSAAVVARLKSAVVEVVEPAMPLLRIHFQRGPCRPRLIEKPLDKSRELQNKRFVYEIEITIRPFRCTRYASHSAVTFYPEKAAADEYDLYDYEEEDDR